VDTSPEVQIRHPPLIVDTGGTNATLALSRNSKACLDTFRQLGNFSAHKIEYTCRREYIAPYSGVSRANSTRRAFAYSQVTLDFQFIWERRITGKLLANE
jgi:hypothetical protein